MLYPAIDTTTSAAAYRAPRSASKSRSVTSAIAPNRARSRVRETSGICGPNTTVDRSATPRGNAGEAVEIGFLIRSGTILATPSGDEDLRRAIVRLRRAARAFQVAAVARFLHDIPRKTALDDGIEDRLLTVDPHLVVIARDRLHVACIV